MNEKKLTKMWLAPLALAFVLSACGGASTSSADAESGTGSIASTASSATASTETSSAASTASSDGLEQTADACMGNVDFRE